MCTPPARRSTCLQPELLVATFTHWCAAGRLQDTKIRLQTGRHLRLHTVPFSHSRPYPFRRVACRCIARVLVCVCVWARTESVGSGLRRHAAVVAGHRRSLSASLVRKGYSTRPRRRRLGQRIRIHPRATKWFPHFVCRRARCMRYIAQCHHHVALRTRGRATRREGEDPHEEDDDDTVDVRPDL